MENAPTISQNFRYNGGWKTLSLTKQELEMLQACHRHHTNEIMKQCIQDVMTEIPLVVDLTPAVCALFEARAEKFFTWVQRALKDKTKIARENGGVVIEEERVEFSSGSIKEKGEKSP